MPKFSIILPVRNGGEYIKECVNSILSQTEQDFNLIILDNCSTDGTREWLTSLNNNKIVIYQADKPLTIEENWARITTVPKNEFITLTGHDDFFYPDFLKQINGLIHQYPNAGLYHTHFNFIDAGSKIIRPCKPMPSFLSFTDLLQGFLTQSFDSMGTGYVMRAVDYDSVGGIPVHYPNLLFADFKLWLSLAAKGGMAIAANSSFAFRVHQSTTGTSQDNKLHAGLELYIDYLLQLKKDNKSAAVVINKHAKELLLFYCQSFSHRLLRSSLEKRNGLTVSDFIDSTKQLAVKLGIENEYKPVNLFSIKLANFIDSNAVSRNLFLLFKKLYSKPVY
jgi:glycosyltransferase involved in cell wall biosynthesis